MAVERIDMRELLREMADQIEESAYGCGRIGAIEKCNRMLHWAMEKRVEAEFVDEEGEIWFHEGWA